MSFALLLVVGCGLAGAPAGAHSDLESTTPATGSVVAEAVEVIELVFTSSIHPDSAEVSVVVDGQPVGASARSGSSDRVLLITPEQPIGGGEVGAAARVLATDGHRIEVGIGFSVDAPAPASPVVVAPPATAAPTSTTSPSTTTTSTTAPSTTAPTTGSTAAPPVDLDASPPSDDELAMAFAALDDGGIDRLEGAQTVVRGMGYAATVLVVGLFVFGRLDRGATAARDLVGAGAAAILALTAVAWAATQAAIHAGGDTGAMFDVPDWSGALEGRLAIGFWLRLVGAAFLAVAALTGRHRSAIAGAVGAAAVVLSYGFIGHNSGLEAGAAVVHVTALSIWIGGLFGLVRTLRSDPTRRASLVSRFSRLAGWMLAVTVAAGTSLAISRLDGPSALWTTTYGRVLTAKVLVVAIIAGLGAGNRLAITRDRGLVAGATTLRLRRVGALELGAAAVAVALTAALVANA